MLIEYIWLLKLKQEICRADLTGDEVFLCCMPQPEVPVHQMHSLQGKTDEDSGLNQVGRKLRTRIHKWARIYDRERAEFGKLPPT